MGPTISYMTNCRLDREMIQARILEEHPPWALPLYVIDTGEIRQCLYFCQNLTAVSYVLSLMGNGEDRAPITVTVQPFNYRVAYIDEAHLNDLFEMFIKADHEHNNWSIIFEYSRHGPEYEILSP